MYINGWTGAVQDWVAVHKTAPAFSSCACSLGARSTVIRNTDHCTGLCVRSRSCDH
ncbi:unnamed protein product [Staurois parvus]|uniref:Uncharacterized protein n=1 Tax=Staurois parvus TaxID=386267 RepID=A0ABN9E3X1_9NEOB|nr:unnamed protein product [Staurois parvus]